MNLELHVPTSEAYAETVDDPTRRAVLKRLRAGAHSVSDIARGMRITGPAVSQHLRVLKAARLVTDRAEGTRWIYAVDTRGIEPARKWLDGFGDEALAALKGAAELEAAKESKR